MTEGWHRQAGLWPPDGETSEPTLLERSVDLSRLRSSSDFRTALARGLDATAVQRGDFYRMLKNCEEVLALAEAELSATSREVIVP